MVDSIFLNAFLESFWKLFVILDPFLSLAVFVSLTRGMSKKEKAKQAFVASSVAFILLIFFLFLGISMLNLFGISLSSFRIAGGIILLIFGAQAVLGIEFMHKDKKRKTAAIIIGTPLLCGPGAITTTILLSNNHGWAPVLLAIILSTAITWVMLYFSEKIEKLLGARVTEVISRVFGLIVAAISIEMIKGGIIAMLSEIKK